MLNKSTMFSSISCIRLSGVTMVAVVGSTTLMSDLEFVVVVSEIT